MPKILITGGNGFIGSHLRAFLAQDPTNQIVVVDKSTGRDLCDDATYPRLGSGYDEVYHFAAVLGVENVARNPIDVLRVNAIATTKLLDWFAAGGGKRLVFASTSEVYAWTPNIPIPTPEDVPLAMMDLSNPRSTYAGSKIFGELAVTQYCQAAMKPFTILRYHNIYGPRMGNSHVIPQLRQRIIDGQDPLIVYSPTHTRAFCYISDAVNATIAAMRTPEAIGQTINVGNDEQEISMHSLAELLLESCGIVTPIVGHDVDDPIKRRCPDIGKARRLLGYNPAVSLRQGLALL